MSALIETTKLCKSYDAPADGMTVPVLNGVSFSLDPGDCMAIVGPSGSGKSTLLNLIGALDTPTSGEIHFKGKSIADMTENAAAAFRNTHIGFVFQFHHLLPQCTVLENVLLPTIPTGNPAEDRARTLLKRVGLEKRMDHRPGQLSGGECQRVAVVRALINSPELLLADEPTGSLDAETSLALAELLVELNQEQNTALILVTHATDLAQRMNRVLQLRDGELVDAE
jgi:ABC-type lipoprotein export system ATPase subunit